MRAWHFLAAGSVMRDGRKAPRDGVKLRHTGPVVPCDSGLHASEHPMDALDFAPGPVLCLVECGGTIVRHGNPVNKIACSERTIIARMDATPLLRLFARMQALSVAHLMGDAPPDVVLDYLMTGDESIMDAARAAARDAARDAARAAAWDAARDAAWAAAWDAARDAAWAAVENKVVAGLPAGQTYDEALPACVALFAPTRDTLQRSALALLDTMLAVTPESLASEAQP